MIVNNYLFCYVYENGNLEVAQWFVKEFKLTKEDFLSIKNYVFGYTCEDRHLEVAQWLVEKI